MEQLLDILSKCTTNPEFLSKASEILQDFSKAEGYLPALLQVSASSQSPEIKTLASILLKNQISSFWDEVSPSDKFYLKQHLASQIVQSPSKLQSILVSSN